MAVNFLLWPAPVVGPLRTPSSQHSFGGQPLPIQAESSPAQPCPAVASPVDRPEGQPRQRTCFHGRAANIHKLACAEMELGTVWRRGAQSQCTSRHTSPRHGAAIRHRGDTNLLAPPPPPLGIDSKTRGRGA